MGAVFIMLKTGALYFMLVIREAQMTEFNRLARERFLDQVTMRLDAPDLAPATRRFAARCSGAKETRAIAARLIAIAREYGFDAVGDVAPFVVLCVIADDRFRAEPCYPWIRAVLQARDYSGEERMRAIHDLLPEQIRCLCFEDAHWGGWE